MMELEPLYKPQGVEERWQLTWEQERLYHADPEDPRPLFHDRRRFRRDPTRHQTPARDVLINRIACSKEPRWM